ncbi:hypothetical protein [Arthrobacter sp. 7Tela_A1]|uniref:hypothetical protein n=1 Tax=Arthrobacter sp. 7Tela_A1 TaxID=3093745 RepID=UPI003BB4FB4B
MAKKTALKATGLVSGAVLLGLLTVQGTYALWDAAVQATTGNIQAATFNVEMDGGNGSVMMAQPDGSAGTVSLATTALGAVDAGASVYAGVRLTNHTDAGGEFTLRAAAGQADTGSLGSLLTVHQRAVPGADLNACYNPALYTGTAAGSLDIPKHGSGVLCFEVSLAATAGAEGQVSTISIPLTVEQIVEHEG